MSKLPVKILGTGVYLPSRQICSEELEKQLGFAAGTFELTSGVNTRYFAEKETSSEMGMWAAKNALDAAQIKTSEIDAVVSVSGVPQQAIPSTAALIHKKLGLKKAVAFDINATCLSFLTGLFCMGNLIAQGVYKKVLLVSSDIASVGLNPKDPKTASLFGDGAAACILGPSGTGGILASHFETLSEHAEDCECEGGGNRWTLKENVPQERLYFRMNGPRLFKAAMPPLLKMVRRLTRGFEGAVDLFIPHQASPFALDLLQKKLRVEDRKFVHIVRDFGNMIAASIPFALHQAIETKRLQRGNKALLFGTAAGLSVGGVLLEY